MGPHCSPSTVRHQQPWGAVSVCRVPPLSMSHFIPSPTPLGMCREPAVCALLACEDAHGRAPGSRLRRGEALGATLWPAGATCSSSGSSSSSTPGPGGGPRQGAGPAAGRGWGGCRQGAGPEAAPEGAGLERALSPGFPPCIWREALSRLVTPLKDVKTSL